VARGCRRYDVFSALVMGLASRAPGDVERALARADEVAVLEAWSLTAGAAAMLDVDRWWGDAERRVERLALAAGPDGDQLRARAGRWLTALR
jgi:hypothetical protein